MSIPTRRSCGFCATRSASRAPNTAAASPSAAPARCTWTAARAAPASRRSELVEDADITTIEGHRGAGSGGRAGGLDRSRRAAMRLLPVRPDHVGGGALADEPEADRRRHRRRHGRQHLPLRHLSPHPPGDPRRRDEAGGLSHDRAAHSPQPPRLPGRRRGPYHRRPPAAARPRRTAAAVIPGVPAGAGARDSRPTPSCASRRTTP